MVVDQFIPELGSSWLVGLTSAFLLLLGLNWFGFELRVKLLLI